MWHEGEIDMEELEARLYSQVYHSNEEETPICKPNPILEENLPSKLHKPRYFDEMQPSIHRVYQTNKPAYFQGYPESSNFYEQPLFTYPAVNNIVILPQPPTHIFATPPAVDNAQNKRTTKRRERKKRQKEKWKAIKRQQRFGDAFNAPEEPVEVEIINISESDPSDCEIEETEAPQIVLSSDDEPDMIEETSLCEIKTESTKTEEKTEPFSTEIKSNELLENKTDDDDDVVLVEPQIEIVSLCDEPPEAESDLILPAEVMDTPESTNDFLDNSFNSNSIDAISNHNKMSVINDFESDSNFSVSDFDGPSSSSAIFAVQAFDVPPHSELNLDSFTNYIASKASTSIASILTPPKKSARNAMSTDKSKNPSSMNSSDSSSESDYEDKVKLIENRKPNSGNKNASSGSDDCVINEALPNLSPITSDEETKLNQKSSETKQKKKHTKKVEKRKSLGNPETIVKKPKRDKEPINFFSSSDSEIEVVNLNNIDNEPPAEFDVELLNIANSSTPKKQRFVKSNSKCFSNYWTEDMDKFYRESWGHEHFDVEQEQQSMSDDPKMWKIINKDEAHYKMLPKGPRCFRCREFGHRAHNCNKIFPAPKCILCAGSGHLESRCPNKMCTSCGRRSYYATTSCSRCANSRHVTCNICHMQGHSSSNCTDLWRRYHLTKTNGPLNQPNDSNLKPSRDRWCSGCATRGHFEFNCNYYNRTHTPVDPVIRSYADVYQKDRQSNDGYHQRPNQVAPWLPINYQPTNTYHGTNQNFYQQFPVFQSIPSIFDLRFNNVFYTNPEMMGTNRSVQDTNQNQKNLVAEIIPEPNPKDAAPLVENDKANGTDFVKLKYGRKIGHSALGFLKKLSQETNVKIKIIKRKKKKKLSYWCMLQGPQEKLFGVKESIKNHFEPEYFNPINIFQGRDFKMPILQNMIAKLDSCNIDWSKVANDLYKKIKETKRKLGDNPNTTKSLNSHYIALSSILIGKVGFAGGYKHMKILREAAESSKKKQQ